jgi:hypothetical protein
VVVSSQTTDKRARARNVGRPPSLYSSYSSSSTDSSTWIWLPNRTSHRLLDVSEGERAHVWPPPLLVPFFRRKTNWADDVEESGSYPPSPLPAATVASLTELTSTRLGPLVRVLSFSSIVLQRSCPRAPRSSVQTASPPSSSGS